MASEGRAAIGRLFDEVPELYDRVRPIYPDDLFTDLVAITGIREASPVLEVGCGTGQATRSLADLRFEVTAVEPGPGMVAVAGQHLGGLSNVDIETSTFEDWDDQGRRFELLVAAASWHWVNPAIGWPKAHRVIQVGGWMALIGNVVVRRTGELEVYAQTADLHERYSPSNPEWRDPPLEGEIRATTQGWGSVEDPGVLFGPPVVRFYPVVQYFDGAGFADLLRSTSVYRRLAPEVRDPLLEAIAERIRTQMSDRAPRRYLAVLRVGQRVD